jgi:hypothetical protein
MFAAKAQLCGQESAVSLQPSPFFVLIIDAGAERSNAQRRLPLCRGLLGYLKLNMGVRLKLLGLELSSLDNIRTDPFNSRKIY